MASLDMDICDQALLKSRDKGIGKGKEKKKELEKRGIDRGGETENGRESKRLRQTDRGKEEKWRERGRKSER